MEFLPLSSSYHQKLINIIIKFNIQYKKKMFTFSSYCSSYFFALNTLFYYAYCTEFFSTESFATGLTGVHQIWGDSNNNFLYLGSTGYYVNKIDVSSRAVTVFGGDGSANDCQPGPVTSSPMSVCGGICGDSSGALYVVCITFNRVVKVDIATGYLIFFIYITIFLYSHSYTFFFLNV
jgi:hypothetical protein